MEPSYMRIAQVQLARSDGGFRTASARCFGSVGSALLAEAEALQDGIRLLPEGTRDQHHYRDYSLELAQLWKSRRNNRSEITMILDDVDGMAASSASFRVVHTKR
jgi:hypothetical protein